jgi:exosortase
MNPQPTNKPNRWSVLGPALILGGVALYAFWPALAEMADRWHTNPQYSHGYLVPVFAVALLFWRRDRLDRAKCRVDWRGLLLIAFGALAYTAGGFLYFDSLSAGALIPTLFGIALLLGGPAALRWCGPMILFLVFMIPLPYAIETALGQPLQSIATRGSTWLLQTMGFPAVSEGNVILLEHGRIAVVEACNGLSMLLTFAAMTTAMAMAVNRPFLDRVLIVVSTIPVAVLVNIVRIAANGVAMEVWTDPQYADTIHKVFHDQGGWLMMPLAILLLWLELWMLGRLLVEAPNREIVPVIGLPASPRAAQPAPVKRAQPAAR